MNEKLKKIANKLYKKYKSLTVNDAYTQFMYEVFTHKEYFNLYTPEQLVKIPIYIYSKIETNGFELGDNMIKNAWIGNIFEYGFDDYANDHCEYCKGDGDERCDKCDGTGTITCDTCDGDGTVSCGECDGYGNNDEGGDCSDCEGSGRLKCDDCDEGSQTCNNCGGDGSVDCSECDGEGEFISDRLIYTNKTIIVWDRKLINMFMNSYELEKPISNQDLLPFINQSMMSYLDQHSDDAEFKTEVKADKIYCFYFEQFLQGGLKLVGDEITTGKKPIIYTYQ